MGRKPSAAASKLTLIQPTTMTLSTPMNPGPPQQGRHPIHNALKRRGVLVVLGVQPSARPDGPCHMSRNDRRRHVRVRHSYPRRRERA